MTSLEGWEVFHHWNLFSALHRHYHMSPNPCSTTCLCVCIWDVRVQKRSAWVKSARRQGVGEEENNKEEYFVFGSKVKNKKTLLDKINMQFKLRFFTTGCQRINAIQRWHRLCGHLHGKGTAPFSKFHQADLVSDSSSILALPPLPPPSRGGKNILFCKKHEHGRTIRFSGTAVA